MLLAAARRLVGTGRRRPRLRVPAGWTASRQRAAATAGGGDTPAAPPPGTPVTAPQLMTDALYSYVLDHTRESDVLRRLRANTAAAHPGRERNMVSPEQGAFLAWMVKLVGAVKAVEVGVFTGYSATCIAAALPPGGTLIALEKDEAPLALARKAWDEAGVASRVDARVGGASASLAALLAAPGAAGSFDFAFIDADKRGYAAYYEQCLALIRPGGVIAVDNLLWYGRVADPSDSSKATLAVRAVNDMLVADERVDFSLVPVGDGIGLCRKR